MEDLLGTIERSCIISPESDVANKRKQQFKNVGRDEDSSRDKRRSALLEDYKRKRENLLNEKRGLLNDEFDDNEDWMDWEEGKKRLHRKWINYNCKDQLMLSEWMLDRPYDLETAWTCVVCPEGRRTLVVSKGGSTRAYHKKGFLLAKFKSILPSGSPCSKTRKSDTVILDCIWKESTKQLFALDVLRWNNQTLLDCDAQFRLYWLKSKLNEVKQFLSAEIKDDKGVYDVFLPTHCNLSSLQSVLSEHNPAEVDGILFYHNAAPYVSGQTPLVGWLKPYMLEERFGVAVDQAYLGPRPADYTTLEQWVADKSHAHTRAPRPHRHKHKMDTEHSDTSSVSTCEMDEVESKPESETHSDENGMEKC